MKTAPRPANTHTYPESIIDPVARNIMTEINVPVIIYANPSKK